MIKKILIIGAGFLQSFIIRKAKEMGYYTLAVDADPAAPGFAFADKYGVVNIVDEKACLTFARENQVDGVLTAATEYGVLSAAYIAQEMNLPGLNYESARIVKNKYLTKKCFIENHIDDTDEQVFELDADTDVAELADKLQYPVMVKPCDGSGSRAASRVDHYDELSAACTIAANNSMKRRAEIETFYSGQEYGAECIVINGEIIVLAIMKKKMTSPPYYAELGHAIPCGLQAETERKARECVTKAIKALDINSGAVNIDMLITDEGEIHIVDIGARMGGNMIGPCVVPYGTGIDYMAAIIQTALGDPVNLQVREHCAVATRLLAFRNGTVKRLPDFEALQKEYNVEIYHHLKVGDNVNEYHTNLDGCGYIVARADSLESAEAAAEKVLNQITDYIFE